MIHADKYGMTKITEHFTLSELTVTNTGLSNKPNATQLACLTSTAQQMEKVRAVLGAPIRVNSGFRSAAVNKAVGGSPTSAHTLGYAVDFVCPAFGNTKAICQAVIAAGIKFDQLILERPDIAGTWVHISFDPRMRGQVLTFLGGKYLSGLRA